MDAVDGDISSMLTVTGTVYECKTGTYAITYKVVDIAGNISSAVRIVDVYTDIKHIAELVDLYEYSEEIRHPLLKQLRNTLDQIRHHLDKSDTITALKHLENLIKHLENAELQKDITEEAKDMLLLNANALHASWTGDQFAESQ